MVKNSDPKARPEGWQVLVQAVRELSMARDITAVTAIIREAARNIVGSQGATFVLKEGTQCYYVDESAIGPLWKGKRFPLNNCVSGWVMQNREPAIIADVMKDERIPKDIYKPTFVKSMLMVPIREQEPIGAIGVYWSAMNKPTMKGLELIRSLADITAVTLENINIHNELEKRVKVRTRELEDINQELETFSYSVSHDLRAPLRAIHGFASILSEEHSHEMTDEAKGLLERVSQNAVQMTNLLDDLLTYFRIGKKEMVLSQLPVSLIVSEIADELKALEHDRKINLSVGELPDICGDLVLFRELWQVLISNALKFTSKNGESKIEVGCANEGGEQIFYIRDNGCGFEMTYYHKLFGVFQRLHSQREFSGSGIGLALAKKIVQKHGGRIWAQSSAGQGATFYFTVGQKKEAGASDN